MSHKQMHPDPTPEEIAARCAEIQQAWSPQEQGSRMTNAITGRSRPAADVDDDEDQPPWQPPVISTRDLG
jgi:hypothetical protein